MIGTASSIYSSESRPLRRLPSAVFQQVFPLSEAPPTKPAAADGDVKRRSLLRLPSACIAVAYFFDFGIGTKEQIDSRLLQSVNAAGFFQQRAGNFVRHTRPVGQRAFDATIRVPIH